MGYLNLDDPFYAQKREEEDKEMASFTQRARAYVLILIVAILLLTALSCNANAATTFTTVNTKVRAWLFENSAAYSIYSDTQINESIASAQEFLLDALPNSCNTQMYAMTSGTASVGLATIPVDLRKVISVEYNNIPAIQIKYSDIYSRLPKATATSPYYMIMNGYFYFYPAGNTAYEITYMKQATAYATGSTALSISDQYIYLLVQATLQEILYVDNQPTRAGAISTLLQAKIAAIRENMNNTNVIEASTATGVKN
jgi:hypothetical protein